MPKIITERIIDRNPNGTSGVGIGINGRSSSVSNIGSVTVGGATESVIRQIIDEAINDLLDSEDLRDVINNNPPEENDPDNPDHVQQFVNEAIRQVVGPTVQNGVSSVTFTVPATAHVDDIVAVCIAIGGALPGDNIIPSGWGWIPGGGTIGIGSPDGYQLDTLWKKITVDDIGQEFEMSFDGPPETFDVITGIFVFKNEVVDNYVDDQQVNVINQPYDDPEDPSRECPMWQFDYEPTTTYTLIMYVVGSYESCSISTPTKIVKMMDHAIGSTSLYVGFWFRKTNSAPYMMFWQSVPSLQHASEIAWSTN